MNPTATTWRKPTRCSACGVVMAKGDRGVMAADVHIEKRCLKCGEQVGEVVDTRETLFAARMDEAERILATDKATRPSHELSNNSLLRANAYSSLATAGMVHRATLALERMAAAAARAPLAGVGGAGHGDESARPVIQVLADEMRRSNQGRRKLDRIVSQHVRWIERDMPTASAADAISTLERFALEYRGALEQVGVAP